MNALKAVFYWEPNGLSVERANPYGAMLARAMAEIGVELIAGHRTDPWDQEWLVRHRGQVHVLHQNWPHYNYDVGNLAGSVARCADFIAYLLRARALGYKVVWTVHNSYPHELLTATAPGYPPTAERAVVINRRHAAQTTYLSLFHPHGQAPSVHSVDWHGRQLLETGWAGCTVQTRRGPEAWLIRLSGDLQTPPWGRRGEADSFFEYSLA